MTYKDIFAVIVSYNGLENTCNTLKSLIGSVGYVYIVDNGSESSSIELLTPFEKELGVSICFLESNFGIGYALNLGVEKARDLGYKWILTMDQDTVVGSKVINSYCEAINQSSNHLCLTPNFNIYGELNAFGSNNSKSKVSEVKYTITSGNLVNMAIYDKIGLYNEDIFIDCVDLDFSLRVRNAGIKINLVGDAIVDHQLGIQNDLPRIISKFYVKHSSVRRYYMYRNFLFIIRKYFFKNPVLISKAIISHFILLFLIPIYDDKPILSFKYIVRGIKDYFKGNFGKLKD